MSRQAKDDPDATIPSGNDRIEGRLAAHDAIRALQIAGIFELQAGNLLRLIPVEDSPK